MGALKKRPDTCPPFGSGHSFPSINVSYRSKFHPLWWPVGPLHCIVLYHVVFNQAVLVFSVCLEVTYSKKTKHKNQGSDLGFVDTRSSFVARMFPHQFSPPDWVHVILAHDSRCHSDVIVSRSVTCQWSYWLIASWHMTKCCHCASKLMISVFFLPINISHCLQFTQSLKNQSVIIKWT